MFQLLFERNADATWLLDPTSETFVDCNAAAVALMRSGTRDRLLRLHPAELSPELQPDGSRSRERTTALIAEAMSRGSVRFEWIARRLDGSLVPLEVIATALEDDDRPLIVITSRDITERKRAEAELRASGELLASVTDNLQEAVYRSDAAHNLIYVNAAYLRLSGYDSLEELRTVPRERLYARPGDRERLMARLARDGGFQNEEVEFVRRDGTRLWGAFSSQAVRDPATGEVRFHIGSVADITERREAARAVRDSEERFRRLFEHSADAMALIDPVEGRFLAVNHALADRLGYPDPGQLIGQSAAAAAPPVQPDGRESAASAAEIMRRALAEGSVRVAWTARRADDTTLPVETVLTAIQAGERPMLLSVSRDVTLRQQAEAALRDSEQKFRTLFESSSEAIVVLDPESGRFVDCNEAAVKWSRAGTKDWLLSQPVSGWAPEFQPDGRRSEDRFVEVVTAALRAGPQQFEWVSKRSDGDEFTCEVVLTPVRIGGRQMLVAVSRDITERKQAEQNIREQNQSLEEQIAERTAALQLANQLLRDEAAERLRREKVERALYRISEAIHEAAGVEDLYPLLHAAVGELMPARNFYLCLHNAATGLHHFVYHRDEMDPPPPPRVLGDGLTGHVFRTGKALLVNRAFMTKGIGSDAGDPRVEHGTPSAVWLGAPLTTQGRTLGVIAVQDYHDEHAFGEAEKRILTFIGEQAGLAIARKRAEQALRESEQKYRALFETSSQGVILHDEKEYLEVNPATLRIFGYSRPEELLGKHPRDTSPPRQPGGESSETLAQWYIGQCLSTGSARFEWMCQSAQGKQILLEVFLTRVEAGGRRLIQAVLNDITERHRRLQVEHALYRISEAIHEADDLGQLYPLIHAAVAGLMPATNFYIAHADPATGRFAFPYWRDQRDPTPPNLPISAGLTGEVLRSGHSLLINTQSLRQSRRVGDHVHFDDLGVTIEVGGGTPANVWLGVPLVIRGRTIGVMAVQDYTSEDAYGPEEQRILTFIAEQTALAIERKRAADAFQQRHREITALLNSLPGYAFFKDAAGRYVMANENFAHAVGLTAASLFGRTDADLFPAELAAKFREDDQRLIQSGETLRVGEEQMVERGRLFYVETTKVPVKNAAGEVVGLIGLGVDITGRKRAEIELRRALQREQELGRMKSNFTSLVSHEFRTPLGVIASSAEILRDYFEQLDPAERREHLETVTKHTRRLGSLMEEVLLLSRFDAGKTEFRAAPIDLADFCRRIADEVLAATGRCCPVTVEVEPDLPAASGDERLLRHILTNLVVNASKYSEPGTEVTLGVGRRGANAVFTVRDRGIGIPETDRQWIFEAFHRGSNVGQRPGTGLGLVVVKRCVDLHGGRIEVTSEVGQGTTMTVAIPMFGGAGELNAPRPSSDV